MNLASYMIIKTADWIVSKLGEFRGLSDVWLLFDGKRLFRRKRVFLWAFWEIFVEKRRFFVGKSRISKFLEVEKRKSLNFGRIGFFE